MARVTYNLSEIAPGYNICWFVASQMWNTATVSLVDDKGRVYFTARKESHACDFAVLKSGNDDFTGNRLSLVVDIPAASDIQSSSNSNSIINKSATKMGQIYTFCIEDAPDEDYNDLYINITGWVKRG